MLPNGEPYLIGRAPSVFPFYVPCARCKRTTKLRASDYNMLPELTNAQLEEMGLLQRYTKDLEGAGFTREEAKDVLPWATGPAELEETLRGMEPQPRESPVSPVKLSRARKTRRVH